LNAENTTELTLEPLQNDRLANLCGQFDEHLRLIERRLGVEISNRGNVFNITGAQRERDTTSEVLRDLYATAGNKFLAPADVHLRLQDSAATLARLEGESDDEEVVAQTRRMVIKARGTNQRLYLRNIERCDISFGVGPAGTGKTYLAVAAAVAALERDRVRRLCLVRPAVEAGERLAREIDDLIAGVDVDRVGSVCHYCTHQKQARHVVR
jgi:phosphate starvation-inducible PhoH-like protein